MKLAYYAPLPPAASGVADYAEAMRAGLAANWELVVNDVGAKVKRRIYHMGNNPLHWEHYQLALRKPGVVILHDAVLHHLLVGQLDEREYTEEFVHNYGEWFREAAGRFYARRAQSASDAGYFARPMLKRLAEASVAVVVHNRAAERMVKEHSPQTSVEVVPHLFVPPRDHSYYEIDTYREQNLQVGKEEVLVGVLGHLRETKRVETVLRAVGDLRREGVAVKLLVQGSFVGEDLERRLEPLLGQEGVIRRGMLPEEEWWVMARALDVAVNLRWPSAGESSGITTRLMGIAKPVVVTRGEETEDIPAVAAVKVDPGLAEREELTSYLEWLCLNAEARRAVGRHAARHVEQEHRLEKILPRIENLVR
ncbi:MAG: glycosyltransferase [Bryobacter sp.]|nr:glycosyltransferase [Bryobacter sp.]